MPTTTINIPSNLVIFIWVFFAVLALFGTIIGINWAKRGGQFDEDIKYQIFDLPDDDIFLPENRYKSSVDVPQQESSGQTPQGGASR